MTESNERIFILPNTLSKTYLEDLKKAALKRNFPIEKEFK